MAISVAASDLQKKPPINKTFLIQVQVIQLPCANHSSCWTHSIVFHITGAPMSLHGVFGCCFPFLFGSAEVKPSSATPARDVNRLTEFLCRLLNRQSHSSATRSERTRSERTRAERTREERSPRVIRAEPRVQPPQHGVDRFLEPQRRHINQALRELRNGKKQSHWMWFVFPQLAGLGTSEKSKNFSIRSVTEAKNYVRDPELKKNLCKALDALLRQDDANRGAEEILGQMDAKKLHSCVTLFLKTADDEDLLIKLKAVRSRFFHGLDDRDTLILLGRPFLTGREQGKSPGDKQPPKWTGFIFPHMAGLRGAGTGAGAGAPIIRPVLASPRHR